MVDRHRYLNPSCWCSYMVAVREHHQQASPKRGEHWPPQPSTKYRESKLLHQMGALGFFHACEVCFVICSISTGQAQYRSTSRISSQSMPSGAEVSHSDHMCERYCDKSVDEACFSCAGQHPACIPPCLACLLSLLSVRIPATDKTRQVHWRYTLQSEYIWPRAQLVPWAIVVGTRCSFSFICVTHPLWEGLIK